MFYRRGVNRFEKTNNKDKSIKSSGCLAAAITLCFLRLMIAPDVADFRQTTEDNVQGEDSSQASATAVACVRARAVSPRTAP